MMLVALMKYAAVVGIIFLLAGLFYGFTQASQYPARAQRQAQFVAFCFLIFVACLAVVLAGAAVHWWPFP